LIAIGQGLAEARDDKKRESDSAAAIAKCAGPGAGTLAAAPRETWTLSISTTPN
jgi:hypothetical protein